MRVVCVVLSVLSIGSPSHNSTLDQVTTAHVTKSLSDIEHGIWACDLYSKAQYAFDE